MKPILFYCTVLLCLQLNAQTQTFNGFYITTKGDTVKGSFPKYTQWARNPEKVDFLPFSSATSIKLTHSNCQKFFVENYDEYILYSGKRLLNPIDDEIINSITVFSDASDIDTVIVAFLRVVIKSSECEILVFNDKIRANFFYKLPDQPIQELRFKKTFSDHNLYEIAEYKNQLNNLFTEEIRKKNLGKKLESLAYTEEGFERFIGELFATSRPKPKAKPSLTIAAGISMNFMNVSGDLSLQEVTSKYAGSVAPLFCVGYILPLSRNFNRFFVYPQLRALNFKNGTHYSTSYSTHTITYQSDFCLLTEVNGGVNVVNRKDLHLFLYGGAGMIFLVNNRETNETIGTTTRYDIATSSMTYSANISAGASLKGKFLVLASYYLPVPVANFIAYSAMHSSLQVGVGYKFK